MSESIVLKLSGKALDSTAELLALFKKASGRRLVVVHGGGVEVDALFSSLGLKVEKKDGLRVSPKEQMPYISAALCGMCNKKLQSLAIACGLNALGLTASDGQTLKVECLKPELGMVGKVEPYKAEFLQMLLNNGITPVMASVAIDSKGDMYNVNADHVAVAVAQLLKAPLYFLSDVKGVLDSHGALIENLDRNSIDSLVADGTVSEGMAVKVKSALHASELTGRSVYIASVKDPLLCENLLAGRRLGTSINGQ